MTALLFGANGQDGYYLAELLTQQGIEVTGVSRRGNWIHADVSNFEKVHALVCQYKPDYIFHLAAASTTRHDFLFENHAAISTGTLNILEAVKREKKDCKVFIAGSGLQFRNIDKPISETDPFEARDAYSMSRIHSVYTARYYRSLGIKAYVGYFFNHDSPRRNENHISKKISEAAKRIANGSPEKIEIGDISIVKEWTYAGDSTKAIWKLVQQDDIFEAVIGSGIGHSIQDWLQECFDIIGKNWKDYTVTKKNFKAEYKQLVSNPSLLFSLGWKPEVSFRKLAEMMMTKT